MKKKIIAILVILALLGAAAGLIKKKRSRLALETPPQMLPVVVAAKRLQAGPVALTQRTTADVEAVRDSVVSSRLSAYVTALPLFEGDRFKRGDVLARLDMSPAGAEQAQGSSLDADLAAAESSLKAEQARLRRAQALYRIQGVSQEQLQATEAAFAAARARQAVARENLRNAKVVAPFDGVVSQRLVQPGDLATPGKPLLKIVDTRSGNRLLLNMPDSVHPAARRAAAPRFFRRSSAAPWPYGRHRRAGRHGAETPRFRTGTPPPGHRR
ncbi:MAG: efflux RND transporter periplasmic adaptor subunit, partial [Sulfuricellaceae bacterium]|nr:efflux RND transporter periplasmic adaptor subunit [Sulfuricellaceae bacterium]